MRRILIRWLINAIALYIAVLTVVGITYEGGWTNFAVLAAIFGLVNTLIGPILKMLSCPLMVLTLGLFTLIINAALLKLTSVFGHVFGAHLSVPDFLSALWGAVVISIVSIVLSIAFREHRKKRD